MDSAHEVASGTVEGMAWSLWSANGQSGAAGLEDGGLVLDGHEYGLCPGYPNPSETEMIDTGGDAVIYGVVNYPGLATVDIGTGSQGFTMEAPLPSPHVAVVNGVSFYIGTLPEVRLRLQLPRDRHDLAERVSRAQHWLRGERCRRGVLDQQQPWEHRRLRYRQIGPTQLQPRPVGHATRTIHRQLTR